MARARKPKAVGKVPGIQGEIKQVERYEYLLIEYLKEMSHEMTYLVLIMGALFFYVLIDLFPTTIQSPFAMRIVFAVLICGGFVLFGLSSMTKRRIERKFERIFG
jgi:uncharacterized membrane protein